MTGTTIGGNPLPVLYGVRQVAQKADVSTAVASYWFDKGWLRPVAETAGNGYRLVDEVQLDDFLSHRPARRRAKR